VAGFERDPVCKSLRPQSSHAIPPRGGRLVSNMVRNGQNHRDFEPGCGLVCANATAAFRASAAIHVRTGINGILPGFSTGKEAHAHAACLPLL